MSPKIVISRNSADWPAFVAGTIRRAVEQVIDFKGRCHLMLTGGQTVQPVYRHWADQPDFPHQQILYYFGDERCVSPERADSNFGQVFRSFFSKGAPSDLRVFRMEAENPDPETAALQYEAALPESIDVMLLSMGEDGHIASLFPGSPALHERVRRVLPAYSPKPPAKRLTIAPPVIRSAASVFLLVRGSARGKVLAEAFKKPQDVGELPVRLLMDATWLLDHDALRQLPDAIKKAVANVSI